MAIKLLPPEIGVDRTFVERFVAEARTLARLNHPNIVIIHESGQTSEGHFYFVMEFVEGTTLAETIRDSGLSLDETLRIASCVCDALHYAHGLGMIHLDIKPANVLIGVDGRVKLADFGISRWLAPGADSGGSRTGTVIGTPAYMAPEQLLAQAVDHRADIYALGVMLYEMLCREAPRGAFQPPSKRIPLDLRIDQVVLKAMQPQPGDRYESVAEMLIDLKAAFASGGLPLASVRGVSRPVRFIISTVAVTLTGVLVVALALSFKKALPEAKNVSSSKTVAPASDSTAGAPTLDLATSSHPWVNSLGMKFVPVPIEGGPTNGQKVFFCIWETRVKDYEFFLDETQRPIRPSPSQGPEFPMARTGWDDAEDFCTWLTERERRAGLLSMSNCYRLPSDHEWSCANGIGNQEDPYQLPADKNMKLPGVYLWGRSSHPPPDSGNYSGEEAIDQPLYKMQRFLKGYRDNFPNVAPVGSFPPNEFGIFDLGGNLQEWTETWYDATYRAHTVRDAPFCHIAPAQLLSSYRARSVSDWRAWDAGFRVVVAPVNVFLPPEKLALPRLEADWVDWFAEQGRAGYPRQFFFAEGTRWRNVRGSAIPLFPTAVRDIAIRVTFRSGGTDSTPASIFLRRRERGKQITGWMGKLSKEGVVSLVKYGGGRPQMGPPVKVPKFDPARELTLQLQVRDKRIGLLIDDELLLTDTETDSSIVSGGCWLWLPAGSSISRLEYRFPQTAF